MAAPITAAAAMRAGTMTQKEETDRQKSLQQQIAESDREDHVRYLEERARRAADVTASALASAASDGAGAPGGGDALEAAIQQHNAMAAEQLPGGDGAAGGKAGPGPGQPSEAPSSPNQSGPDGGPIVAETGAGRLKPATRRWLHVDYFGGVLPRDLWKPWAPAPTGSELQGRTYKRGKWAALKERIWMFLSSPESSIWAYACSLILLFIILIAVLGFILETIPQLNTPDSRPVFKYLEAVCIQVFALEYLLKLFSTDVPKLQFIREPLNVVDLVAIVPWYIEQILNNSSAGSSTAFLRVLRLFRVFRVLKLSGRYSKIGLVMRTLTNSVDMLLMMVFLTSLAIVMFSTLIFFCERGSMHPTLGYFVRNGEPNTQECILPAPVGGNGSSITTECPVPSPFTSIPESFWWCIVTLMTVGYGDVVPITVAGKLVASLCMVVGILTLALPISVIGTNFTQVWLDQKMSDRARAGEETQSVPVVGHLEALLEMQNLNIEDLSKLFGDLRSQVDLLRARLSDRIRAKQLELEHDRRNMDMRSMHVNKADGGSGGGAAQGAIDIQTRLLEMMGERLFERYQKDLHDLTDLELLLAKRMRHLGDLIRAANLLQASNITALVRDTRFQYKQFDFLVQETFDLRSSLLEMEGELVEVDMTIASLEERLAAGSPNQSGAPQSHGSIALKFAFSGNTAAHLPPIDAR